MIIPSKVTIAPCNIGMGYFYRGACFAYVWATPPFSTQWWMNLALMTGVHIQDLRNAGEKLRKKKRKAA